MWVATNIKPPGKMGPRSWRKELVLVCDFCSMQYFMPWSRTWMRKSEKHYCSNKCAMNVNNKCLEKRKKISKATKKYQAKPKVKEKQRERTRALWKDDAYVKKQREAHQKVVSSKEFREKMSLVQKEVQNRPEVSRKKSISCAKTMRTPEARERQRQYALVYQNQEITKRKRIETMKSNKTIGKSNLEKKFGEDLISLFPDAKSQYFCKEWVFDFFIPSLGVLVEFDGVYWHGLDRDVEEIKLFKNSHDKNIYKNIIRDKKKNQHCKDNGITLVRVTDEEYKKAKRTKEFKSWLKRKIQK